MKKDGAAIRGWLIFCTVWINFVLGALVPITPKLNEVSAGLAFSAFAFVKVLVFVPAGILGDRIGHFTGILIALAAQVTTLALISLFPDYVWLARGFEGVTLAFGTVSALAMFRLYARSPEDFSNWISLLLGIGSSGFLLGPFFGFTVEVETALRTLLAVSALLVLAHFLFLPSHRAALRQGARAEARIEDTGAASAFSWPLVFCFALLKGLGTGTEPLFGWWAVHDIRLSPKLAGVTFICGALGFMVGNWRPRFARTFAGFFGLLFLELSLSGSHSWWWGALFLLGLFSGTALNLCLTRLGWNKPENLGRKNATWLALSDIPMMLTPAILWQLRDAGAVVERGLFLGGLMLVALLLMRGRVA